MVVDSALGQRLPMGRVGVWRGCRREGRRSGDTRSEARPSPPTRARTAALFPIRIDLHTGRCCEAVPTGFTRAADSLAVGAGWHRTADTTCAEGHSSARPNSLTQAPGRDTQPSCCGREVGHSLTEFSQLGAVLIMTIPILRVRK